VKELHTELDQPFIRVSLIFIGCDRVDRVRCLLGSGVIDDVEAL